MTLENVFPLAPINQCSCLMFQIYKILSQNLISKANILTHKK